MKQILLVGIGGGLGSILRYLINELSRKFSWNTLPFGTLTANLLGSLLIGILLGYFTRNQGISQEWSLLLITGFCGGFTTFSTFSAENFGFIQSGNYTSFLLYTIGSVLLGIIAVFLGFLLTK
ncbi:fluoride efflux transporter CrcB [Shivajiella indica]|uniref:Fluoride-specific ion channel FluC n=1 Tax=Shivajiella indica TaxID=872115 RepID=A0ABW5B5F0_9BACT